MDADEIFDGMVSPDGRADPYPYYAQMHELGESFRVGQSTTVMVVGYDAISAVLRDPAFRAGSETDWDASWAGWREHPVLVQGADWLLNLHGDKHARIRSLFAKAFTPRRVAGLEPAIGRIADDLLDAMADRGAEGSPVEFMHDFAYLLPITVICELIGIPEVDRESFRPIARNLADIFELSDVERMPSIDAAAVELLAYFTGLAATRRAHPQDDLISDLLAISDADDGRLSDAELLHNMTLLLVAGFETTTNLLGNGLAVLLGDPAVGAAVRDGSAPVPGFVDEVLRYDSPVQLTSRMGFETKIGDTAVTEGDEVMTVLAAGNRDPRRFTHPDRFDPLRAEGAPLSFGAGAHYCIGAALARLEGNVAFPRLLGRFPAIAAAGAPVRRETLLLRGFDELPITVG
ncbi:MAG TPA: cytochrome P450 [Streptosporangiaceae bacterium]|jgi:cytochrome P450